MNRKIEKSIKIISKNLSNDLIVQKKTSNFLMNIINMIDINSTFCRFIAKRGSFEKYKIISNKFKIYNTEWYFPNNYYGIAKSLYEFSDCNIKIKACIEHGLYLGDNSISFEINNKLLPAIITFGEYRKTYLQKISKKKIFKIGPYIHYAKDIYDERKISLLKKKNGKTLLVFPTHSIENIYADYNIDNFIKEIKKVKDTFNVKTVMVCLYWADINKGIDKIYINNGFKVVTAGYREDNLFLSRLKSIINLSDFTMSNNVGTHVGYCIYLNKPHYIVKQEIKYIGKTSKDYKMEFNGRDMKSYYKDLDEILKIFSIPLTYITHEQLQKCNKFWGFNEIKSPEEIKNILKNCDNLFDNMHL